MEQWINWMMILVSVINCDGKALRIYGFTQGLKSMQNRKQTDFVQTGLLNRLIVCAEMEVEL